MKYFATGVMGFLIVVQLGGCARTNQAVAQTGPVGQVGRASRPVASGIKPASQVSACCRPLAEGRISLDQCMQNPTCVANNRSCCMNAIQ